MSQTSMTIEAVFEQGVFRPVNALSLPDAQRVTLIVQVPGQTADWPPDVAEIYQETAEADRRLAESMWPSVTETWPNN